MMVSSCWGVLQTDRWTDKQTDICECRVAFATENIDARLLDKIFLKHPELRVKSLKETMMDAGELDSTSGKAAISEGKVPVIMNDDENAS